MNLLTLKVIAFDADRDGFFSPSHTDFLWRPGIVASECKRCTEDTFDHTCGCGIYSSPNPIVLGDYEKFKNSVYVLMNTYGWVDLYIGPYGQPNTVIYRSWGTQIIGVVGTTLNNQKLSAQREMSSILLTERFGVDMFSWAEAKAMIGITWNEYLKVSPYAEQTPEWWETILKAIQERKNNNA